MYYFDKDQIPTSDPEHYQYRKRIPLDEHGMVRGDVVYERKRKDSWKNVTSTPYTKKEIWAHLSTDAGPNSVRAFRLLAKESDWDSNSETVTAQPDGKFLSILTISNPGKKLYSSKNYYKSGMLREEMKLVDSTQFFTRWHDNGQLHSVTEVNKTVGLRIREVYDRSGKKALEEGNGWAVLIATPINHRNVYEQGKVVNTQKTGRWTGKFADSTLVYEEFYEEGILTKGITHVGDQRVEYANEFMIPAKFPGPDSREMQRFMGQNIRYPIEAHRNNITGRVLITFLINPDGSSSDFQVEFSADKRLEAEALRVAKLMNGKWQPAMFKGRAIQSRYSMPVGFNVESSGLNVMGFGVKN